MKCFTCKEQATERITFTNGLSQNYCSGCAGIFEDGTIEHRVSLTVTPTVPALIPSRFYTADRERAKTNVSELTLAYITALEQAVKDAYQLWIVLNGDGMDAEAAALYDSLDIVNCLDEAQ